MKNFDILKMVDNVVNYLQPLAQIVDTVAELIAPQTTVHAHHCSACATTIVCEDWSCQWDGGECRMKKTYRHLAEHGVSCTYTCDNPCYQFGADCGPC